MICILQINIGKKRGVHDLVMTTAANIKADVIMVTEPSRTLGQQLDSW